MKSALVLGAGGFIGSHLVTRLKSEGYWVAGVDLKLPEFEESIADDFIVGDLRIGDFVDRILERNLEGTPSIFDEVYQLAADMGGAGFVFTGENDADILHNSTQINLNVLNSIRKINARLNRNETIIFYSSSACVYPEHNQLDPENPNCQEDSVYPAAPDSEYGWEKLYSERLYLAYHRNYGIPIRIARYHNVYGPNGTWRGGREKAPAAICRKVSSTPNEGFIEIWGDGKQTRSFLYIDDCIEATRRFMVNLKFNGPINIGSEEMITINELVRLIANIAGKNLFIKNLQGPVGVRGRNSDNTIFQNTLNWNYQITILEGLSRTYNWIESQVKLNSPSAELEN
jgi:nucleoside-diphosphate-sugar epimerase